MALLPPSHPRRDARTGFTLVELLVVVGITAILAGLVLAALRAAIEGAKSAKCASNMRSLGVAFSAYMQDHGGFLPQRYYADQGNGYEVLLLPYLGNNGDVFRCPSFPRCSYPHEPSYGMNWYYDNVSVAVLDGSTPVILAAETLGSGTGSRRADRDSLSPGQLDPARHEGKSNYLFFDGHVEKLSYQATITPVDEWGTDHGNHAMTEPRD